MLTAPIALLDACRSRVSAAHGVELLPRLGKALERYPYAPPLLYSMGMLCLQFGYSDLWDHYTRLGFVLPHLTWQDLVHRGEAKIRLGDWSGWRDREARVFNPREFTVWEPYARDIQWTTKAWDGLERIDDLTLAVIVDGGFGDCFQMLRYVTEIAALAARVVLAVSPSCLAVVQHNLGRAVTVISRDALPFASFQRYVWVMSLPAIRGSIPPFAAFTTPGTIQSAEAGDDRLRIGVCWAGDSNHPTTHFDRSRSILLGDLAPLLGRDDARCFSLQVGPWVYDAAHYPRLLPPPTPLITFTDTANVIAGLDCVVTSDTAIAHLAGMLGVPTFLLLTCAGEFRWGMDDTTPWYPSLRLIRQPTRGDWPGVVRQLMRYVDRREFSIASSSIAASSRTALGQSPNVC
jgi:hypothetical protein